MNQTCKATGAPIPRYWLLALALVAFASVAAACDAIEGPVRDAMEPPGIPQNDEELLALEREVEERTNSERLSHDLDPLEHNQALAAVAREYSCRMASEDFFAHESPDGGDLGDRMEGTGIDYRSVGENLALLRNVSHPGSAVVEGWMDSEGHRENIVRPDFEEIGVGICQEGDALYFTQLFLRQR